MNLAPLPENQYLRAVELKERIRKSSRNNEEGPRFSVDQPEHLDLEELTAQLVKEITGASAWELDEDEFVELGCSQNRYACFTDITSVWHKLIIDGINSGECKTIKAEGLDTIAWRGISKINTAYYAKYGLYLWEPGTGITESKEESPEDEGEEQEEDDGLPKGHDAEGQLKLF